MGHDGGEIGKTPGQEVLRRASPNSGNDLKTGEGTLGREEWAAYAFVPSVAQAMKASSGLDAEVRKRCSLNGVIGPALPWAGNQFDEVKKLGEVDAGRIEVVAWRRCDHDGAARSIDDAGDRKGRGTRNLRRATI